MKSDTSKIKTRKSEYTTLIQNLQELSEKITEYFDNFDYIFII